MMRTRWVLVTGALVLVRGVACSAMPPVTVVHVGANRVEGVQGDPVKIHRGASAAYAGLRDGYFVVRSLDDWRTAWQSGEEPALPPTVDMSRQMLLVAVADKKSAVGVKVQRVVETADLLHVWVRETKHGEGCLDAPDKNPFDAVVVPRIEKAVKFYVEDEPAEACGAPPATAVKCRVGEGAAWSEKLAAAPGDSVECLLTAESRGRFAVVDRVLSIASVPGGSASKLAFTKAPVRGAFPVDVFGTYTIRGEATDDGDRKAVATATVEVLPPKSKDVLVQLVWTDFDATDDPSTFPRVALHAKKEDGKKPKDCSADAPLPGFCAVKAQSGYAQMTLAASDAKVPLSVAYADERVEKGPAVCVQLWFDGARTTETCDHVHRAADDKWEIGVVDMATGKLVADELAAAAASDAGAPSGAADGGPPADAGAAQAPKAAKPKAAQPKTRSSTTIAK